MAEWETPQGRGRKKRDWLSIAGMAAVAGAAAFTSYSGLAGLAEMAGWNHLLAKFLPITVDAYAMTATRVWLSPARLTEKARGFARRNAFGAIIASVVGNALYHAATAHVLSITWPMVVGLSAVPPVTLGLITHLYHTAKDTEPETQQSPGPAIADPDTVRAAYPILGNASALNLPPATGTAPGAPGRASAPGPRPSAPRKTAASAPPSAPRPAVAGAGSPAATPGNPGAVARNWAEREAQLLPKASEINTREIAAGNGPVSARTLAKELHVSQANAGKLVKALNAPAQPGAGQPAPASPVGNPAAGPGNPPPAPGPAHGGIPVSPTPASVAAVAQPEAHPAAIPATTPDAAGPDGSSTPGPLGPGALPAQRESPIAHANGTTMNAP